MRKFLEANGNFAKNENFAKNTEFLKQMQSFSEKILSIQDAFSKRE